MDKSKPNKLFIAISPFGVYVRFCPKCGEDAESFDIIDENQYIACRKCGTKFGKWSAEETAKLGCAGECDSCTKH